MPDPRPRGAVRSFACTLAGVNERVSDATGGPDRDDSFAIVRQPASTSFDRTAMAALDRWCACVAAHQDAAFRDRCARTGAVAVDLGLDPATVIAALVVPLLADDQPLSRLATFDATSGLDRHVARICDGVARIRAIRWHALGSETIEGLRHMILAVATDVRVVVVALAEHLEHLREVSKRDDDDARLVAQQARDVFAPLANRLGIWPIKWQLEDLALRCLEPGTYHELSRLLAETRAQRDQYIARVVASLRDELARAGITATVSGRPKHIYSIYNKMQRKQVGFDEIYDVSAVRVLVDAVPDCYAALGYVHGQWAPIPGEFDDYIAKPKANLYQSLHTAVVGPDGKTLEIQIRTHAMHEYAERGVAAHWAYKEGRASAGPRVDRQYHLLRQLLDWQRDMADPAEAAATLTHEVLAERVYAFTPRGDVIDLPAGATALDFAYRVHTLVGHRCNGARVNDQIVPLDRAIRTGDRVQILTRKQPSPSRDWLNPNLGYLHTSSARQKLRQWFRQQERDAAIASGRELLDKELARLSLSSSDRSELATSLDYATVDDLLAAIGFGDVGTHRVGARALEAERGPVIDPEPRPVATPDRPRPAAAAGVVLDGIGNVLSQPARCCSPLPGDPVIGFLSRGRGVVIHHRDCPNVRHRPEPERFVDLEWGQADRVRYPVTILVRAVDRRGLLRDVLDQIAACHVDVRATNTQRVADDDLFVARIVIEAQHSEQIVRVMDRLGRAPDVVEVRRIRQ
ncbi:MAG: bifunctional (p)ppGpp synthetase/guanosine-3',5'-bis(diphosphate) 3'-pyrophosphohydrolase [Myxococcales bacterium FL481]|nr:MAG: bifunctional (p)ppGpp synthetase/guanosine-3',5'-bis(diphosphate) 3'-pyrophosphohydrolase [Myxococcales bacterium FL481]